MGILKFLLYFFTTLFILGWVLRLLAPFILRWASRRLARQMEQQSEQFQHHHQRQYDAQYREEVRVDRDLKVKVPRREEPNRTDRRLADAEAVDFEEVPADR
jgi:hypothetical protein